jgi:hypothetical protein
MEAGRPGAPFGLLFLINVLWTAKIAWVQHALVTSSGERDRYSFRLPRHCRTGIGGRGSAS